MNLRHDGETLDQLLGELLDDTPDVTVRGTEHSRKGVVFAARPDANSVELRLGPDIAEAALHTPHTVTSPRGEEWVRLSTTNWGDANDRLEAWYRVAWRLAAKQKR